jgi:hypothetical protein
MLAREANFSFPSLLVAVFIALRAKTT